MRNLSLLFILLLIQLNKVCAQPPRIDKNIVMDFLQNTEYEEAITYLLEAEKADSLNLQILGYLGYAYTMTEDIGNASRYYNKMLDIDSTNVSANLYFTNLYGNILPEAARPYVRRLINGNPRKAVYQRKMGDLFRRRNQRDSAFVYYTEAFRLSPNDDKNGAALADLLIDLKNFVRADSIINEGLDKDSLSVIYLKLRIKSSYDAEAYQQVLLPGERLMRLGEGSLSTLTQVALSYYNLKLYKDCIRVCDHLVDRGMGGENVFYYSAKSHARLQEYDISNELLRICLSLSISKTAEYYYNALGENYEGMKQYKKAITHYDTAYYMFKDPLMLYSCGRVMEEYLKNNSAAKNYYSKYMRLAKPKSEGEKKAYEYIRKKYFNKPKKKVR